MSSIIKDTLSMLREADDEITELRALNAELLELLKRARASLGDLGNKDVKEDVDIFLAKTGC